MQLDNIGQVCNVVICTEDILLTMCLTSHRYTNCSLIKYMEKHKVKPDSKAFHLVSWNSSGIEQ